MGIKERKERKTQDMRQCILKTAMELFAKGGFGNVSMRGIAKKIEYSPGTIYRYFKNKEDIMRQLCYQGFDQMLSLQHRIDDIEDPLERLIKGCHDYITFAMNHQALYELMFATEQLKKHADKGENSVARRSFLKLVEHVGQCIDQGVFGGKSPETLAIAIWAAIHGLSSLLIKKQLRFLPEPDIESIIHDTLAFILKEKPTGH